MFDHVFRIDNLLFSLRIAAMFHNDQRMYVAQLLLCKAVMLFMVNESLYRFGRGPFTVKVYVVILHRKVFMV
jgi:hypothetical protein